MCAKSNIPYPQQIGTTLAGIPKEVPIPDTVASACESVEESIGLLSDTVKKVESTFAVVLQPEHPEKASGGVNAYLSTGSALAGRLRQINSELHKIRGLLENTISRSNLQ